LSAVCVEAKLDVTLAMIGVWNRIGVGVVLTCAVVEAVGVGVDVDVVVGDGMLLHVGVDESSASGEVDDVSQRIGASLL
jgi:hypothetical protein